MGKINQIKDVNWVSKEVRGQFLKLRLALVKETSDSYLIVSEDNESHVATIYKDGDFVVHKNSIFSEYDVSLFKDFLRRNINEIIHAVESVNPEVVTERYNHAFTLAFSLNSNNDGDNVTAKELLKALKLRVTELETTGEIIEAVGLPYDSYEN